MKDFAPILAGTPPAFILSVQLYKSVAAILGIVGLDWYSIIPGILAAVGMAGMVWVELKTYKTAAEAFAQNEIGPFIVSAICAVTLSGLVVFAVYIGADTKSLLTSTVGMIIGYIVIATRQYMATRKEKAVNDLQSETAKTANQIALLNAQANANKVNAAAETQVLKARANLAGVEGVQPVQSVSTVQLDKMDTPKARKVKAWFAANPGKSARDCAKALTISQTTASRYKPQ